MSKTVGLLSSVIAIIAGVVGGISFLHRHHTSTLAVVFVVGIGLFVLTAGAALLLRVRKTDVQTLAWWGFIGSLFIGMAVKGLVFTIALGAFGTAWMITIWIELYLLWRGRTKSCPDCAESVKAEAKICRYCWHEFAPRVTPTSAAGIAAISSAASLREQEQ